MAKYIWNIIYITIEYSRREYLHVNVRQRVSAVDSESQRMCNGDDVYLSLGGE